MRALDPTCLLLAAIVAACALPAGGTPGRPGWAAPSSPGVSTATSPGASAAGTPAALGPASAGPGRSAPSVQRTAPPPALLAGTVLGPAASGTLGSWALAGGGADSPWLPAAALKEIRAVAGARLVARFGDGTRIGSWQAQVAAAADTEGAGVRGLGGRDAETPALDEVIPDALGPGTWVLSIRLGLADGGSATYYWLLSVS